MLRNSSKFALIFSFSFCGHQSCKSQFSLLFSEQWDVSGSVTLCASLVPNEILVGLPFFMSPIRMGGFATPQTNLSLLFFHVQSLFKIRWDLLLPGGPFLASQICYSILEGHNFCLFSLVSFGHVSLPHIHETFRGFPDFRDFYHLRSCVYSSH